MNSCPLCHKTFTHEPVKIPGLASLAGCGACAAVMMSEIVFAVNSLTFTLKHQRGDDQDVRSTQ